MNFEINLTVEGVGQLINTFNISGIKTLGVEIPSVTSSTAQSVTNTVTSLANAKQLDIISTEWRYEFQKPIFNHLQFFKIWSYIEFNIYIYTNNTYN